MNFLANQLLTPGSWTGLMMGDYAIARAILECGVSVITSYPGSPVPEIGQALELIPRDRRKFYFEFSSNEKVASEIAFGASINGHLSTVFFKSVGLNVASDALFQVALLNVIGGMVVVLGDDPGANSSQNEQDNRHYARLMYIPMLEPASPSEAYAMFKSAAQLSQKIQRPVFLRLTTHICHAHEVIEFQSLPSSYKNLSPQFNPANGPYFPLTQESIRMKLETIAKIKTLSENLLENTLYTGNIKDKGIISAGMPALAIREILEQSGQKPDLLKLGMTYPIPEKLILDFLNSHEEVLIIEELDRIIEREIKVLAWEQGISSKIYSKEDPFIVGEIGLSESLTILSQTWPDIFQNTEPEKDEDSLSLPVRSAQLCPGCGHRSALYAIKQALTEEAAQFTVAGIGCHLMSAYKPYELGKVLLCMGHSPSTATGLSLFNPKHKVVAFLGDSTFFHTGMPAIVNAATYNHNITVIIMDNFITAMTGHQSNAGSGGITTVFGKIAPKISIMKVLESLNIGFLRNIEAYSQQKLTEAVRESLEYKGFAVIIAKHPCMLNFTRQKRKQEYLKKEKK
jgi:indolepyruvate ferredoxin oxidoreductase, alpha subunit